MIFALESSCDETALAVFDPARGLRGEWVHSQMALHELHGGVVPDLAAREHLRRLPALLAQSRAEWGQGGITRVAVTQGPGLAACLALGLAAAKSLALAWRVPVRGINHLRGHAWSPFLALHAAAPEAFSARLDLLLPHLGLIASGGHTLLFTIDRGRRIACPLLDAGRRGRGGARQGSQAAGARLSRRAPRGKAGRGRAARRLSVSRGAWTAAANSISASPD